MVFDMQDHDNQPLRHGRDVDSSMNCTFCTTGTKTTLSNCNCEISMVRTMGISHSEKQGCQRPWRTATAEQGAPVIDQHGHNNNLVRKLHHEDEELDYGELPLRHNRNVRKTRHLSLHNEKRAHLCPRTAPPTSRCRLT